MLCWAAFSTNKWVWGKSYLWKQLLYVRSYTNVFVLKSFWKCSRQQHCSSCVHAGRQRRQASHSVPVPSCPCPRPDHHVLLGVARETKRETEIEAWWKGDGGRETFWLTAPSSQSRGWNADEVHVNQEQCSLFSSYSIFISLPPFPPLYRHNSLSLFRLFKRKYTRNPLPTAFSF